MGEEAHARSEAQRLSGDERRLPIWGKLLVLLGLVMLAAGGGYYAVLRLTETKARDYLERIRSEGLYRPVESYFAPPGTVFEDGRVVADPAALDALMKARQQFDASALPYDFFLVKGASPVLYADAEPKHDVGSFLDSIQPSPRLRAEIEAIFGETPIAVPWSVTDGLMMPPDFLVTERRLLGRVFRAELVTAVWNDDTERIDRALRIWKHYHASRSTPMAIVESLVHGLEERMGLFTLASLLPYLSEAQLSELEVTVHSWGDDLLEIWRGDFAYMGRTLEIVLAGEELDPAWGFVVPSRVLLLLSILRHAEYVERVIAGIEAGQESDPTLMQFDAGALSPTPVIPLGTVYGQTLDRNQTRWMLRQLFMAAIAITRHERLHGSLPGTFDDLDPELRPQPLPKAPSYVDLSVGYQKTAWGAVLYPAADGGPEPDLTWEEFLEARGWIPVYRSGSR